MRSPVGLLLWTRVCVQRCSFSMLCCYISSVSIFCQWPRIQVHLHLLLNYHHLFHVALHLVLTCIYFHTPGFHHRCFSTPENSVACYCIWFDRFSTAQQCTIHRKWAFAHLVNNLHSWKAMCAPLSHEADSMEHFNPGISIQLVPDWMEHLISG